MKKPVLLIGSLLCLGYSLEAAAADGSVAARLSELRGQLDDAENLVNRYYMPTAKVGRAFAERCKETDRALRSAQTINEAYALISDALCSVDPRIRFYPPQRQVEVDYGWNWAVVGDAVYVTQVDQVGAARQQGLLLGDRVLAIEGIPVDRTNYQQVYHLLNYLDPRPGLRVLAQTGNAEPRLLALEATIRERRRVRQVEEGSRIGLERVRTAREEERWQEFREPKRHFRQVGTATIWNADDLARDLPAVNEACALFPREGSLIIDLRGHYLDRHDVALRVAESLFERNLSVGRIDTDGLDTNLKVSGRKDAFLGTVLVLTDSTTGGYAELLAYLLQREQRAVVVGDRTMGRVFEPYTAGQVRGRSNDFRINVTVTVPAGELVLNDGSTLDGRGVIPDYQVLPAADDFAGHRDLVLARALGLLKQKISPEDAYRLFPHPADEDDEY